MIRVQRGSTATISAYPPALGQASAATARIGTPAVALPEDGSAATVDAVSTDVAGDAAEGRTEIAVTSATWVRGRKYVATSTTGVVFPIVSASSGASDTLYLQEPLPTALLTGSTIKGYRVSIALTADQTAERGRSVVEWSATIDGIEYVWAEDFEIVERGASDKPYTLDHITLTRSSPYVKRLKPDADVDHSETIEAAWRRYIEPALLAKGIKPHLFVSRTELEPAHIAACEYFAAQGRIDFEATEVEDKRRELTSSLDTVLSSHTLWIDPEAQTLAPPASDAPRPYNVTMIGK